MSAKIAGLLKGRARGSVLVEYVMATASSAAVFVAISAGLSGALETVIQSTAVQVASDTEAYQPIEEIEHSAPPAETEATADYKGSPSNGTFFVLPLSIEDARNVYLRGQPEAFEDTSLRLAVKNGVVGVVCDWMPGCYGTFDFDAEIYAVNPTREASGSYSMILSMEYPFQFTGASRDLGTHEARKGVVATIPVETRSIGGFNPEQPAEFDGTNLRLARKDDQVALICDWAGGCAGSYVFPVTLNSWNPDLTISDTFTVTIE